MLAPAVAGKQTDDGSSACCTHHAVAQAYCVTWQPLSAAFM
jgi:hypothetical protein